VVELIPTTLQNHAFFPGLAYYLSLAERAGVEASIAGLALNFVSQAIVVVLLPKLLVKVNAQVTGSGFSLCCCLQLGVSTITSQLAAIMYLLNPAVPFFNAIYTESVYSALTTAIIYAWLR
jgi:hypothetical protein